MGEERISATVFDLFSPDRLALVSELSVRKQRLTALSQVVDQTLPECSRDLKRLCESGLIQKDSEGLFEVTPFGRAMLCLVPGLRFLVKERSYFLSHDLSFLPRGFVERIGELSNAKHLDHLSLVLDNIRAVMSKASKYTCLMTDQMVIVGTGIGKSFTNRGIPVRGISEATVDHKTISEIKSLLPRSENRFLGEVRVALAINETAAGVCFPDQKGKIDFTAGFAGSDSGFREWCEGLFEYYWSKSKKT